MQKKVLTTNQKKVAMGITKGLETKSSKIRALAAAGWSRGDIARYMDIRYQHVRNVLEQKVKSQ